MNPYAGADTIETSQSGTDINIQRHLFTNAMKGNWVEVVKIYTNNRSVHKAKITKAGDTAIHVAISGGQVEKVQELVEIVRPDSLKIQNNLGDTPLHKAAMLGNVKMCECIAKKDPSLIGIRNNEKETPFFLAVLHGKKDAFLCLNSYCEKQQGYQYCRRRDGDTILHVAISGEHFDMAFHIVNFYDDIINAVNKEGVLPLRLLANKPSAFESASNITGFRKLIYHCIFVDELQVTSSKPTRREYLKYDRPKSKYPENYHTCMNLVYSLWHVVRASIGWSTQHDAENPVLDKSTQQPKLHEVGCSTQQTETAKDPNTSKGCSTQQTETAKDPNTSKGDAKNPVDKSTQQPKLHKGKKPSIFKSQGHQFFPENYRTCFHGLKLLSKAMLVILGLGFVEIEKLRNQKEKHVWSNQIMEKLLKKAKTYAYDYDGESPLNLQAGLDGETTPYNVDPSLIDSQGDKESHHTSEKGQEMEKGETPIHVDVTHNKVKTTLICCEEKKGKALDMKKGETAILIAAKNGVMEMVEAILYLFPIAIHDMNIDKKNIVLLAVENRQPDIYRFLMKHQMKETIFRQIDKDGNSALHLASRLGDDPPWRIPGAALQMQWECKWSKFVRDSMEPNFFVTHNKIGETADEVFTAQHKDLVKEGGQWLTNTSESCSVVAALIATVAFATAATVPGGLDQTKGSPILEGQTAFSIFAIASLVALCFSVTSLVMFLAILTSRYQEKDFNKDLPLKMFIGMTSLFISITSILVSFCAGHFFVMKQKLEYVALPVYVITCLPVTFFAAAQFPLYFDLARSILTKVPRRSYK